MIVPSRVRNDPGPAEHPGYTRHEMTLPMPGAELCSPGAARTIPSAALATVGGALARPCGPVPGARPTVVPTTADAWSPRLTMHDGVRPGSLEAHVAPGVRAELALARRVDASFRRDPPDVGYDKRSAPRWPPRGLHP
ncbi:MAG: hypothetical protein JWM85_1142, partial [Acidimicrobiaceae bacterium]|nr:hypothetical protein [Acidimicrobiaceae bacterium]